MLAGEFGTEDFYMGSRLSVTVDPELLTDFVRKHFSVAMKINRLCDDRAIVPYHELLLDFRGTLETLFSYLGIRFSPACIPNLYRIQKRDMRDLVSNWVQLQDQLAYDVREHLDSLMLF